MVVIIDYGLGNLGSIANMIKKIGYKSETSSDLNKIKNADKLILPGVGSFDKAMQNIEALGMVSLLNERVINEKVPILGICLGMQLMTKYSEEGRRHGLGWIDAQTTKFISPNLKIPHMGWNIIKHKKSSKLFDEFESEKRYYFVHNYYVEANQNDDILTTTPYTHNFVSSFEKGNIIGCQFHPEKSHKFGMTLLKNFLENY